MKLRQAAQKDKISFLPTSAFLILISGCFFVFLGGTFIRTVVNSLVRPAAYLTVAFQDWLITIFGFVALGSGVTAAIPVFKRRRFALSVYGASILVFSGAVITGAIAMSGQSRVFSALAYSLPLTVLSFLGLLSLVLSKNDFK